MYKLSMYILISLNSVLGYVYTIWIGDTVVKFQIYIIKKANRNLNEGTNSVVTGNAERRHMHL